MCDFIIERIKQKGGLLLVRYELKEQEKKAMRILDGDKLQQSKGKSNKYYGREE